MDDVQSYLNGSWAEGVGEGRAIYSAVTGDKISAVATEGLDLERALNYARDVGGPTLRAMTFAERGAVLKAMARSVYTNRDELIELSRLNYGATRGDAKFDIDGASGTLSYYAYLSKELGDRTFLVDGEAENVLKSPRFVGQHVEVPRHGVAIHINAFNFPCWGLAEKAAAALLAGVPVFAKPATATSIVTARMVALWVEEGILPEGALSLLSGSIGDLLDHVGPQDCIAFTGGTNTARVVRGHPAVVANHCRVNIEADSLNASVLGPDIEPGSDTWWMFVNDVAKDLIQKAGQKCTAVRRIFAPESTIEAVAEALADKLSASAVGDPAEKTTTVGPLATAAQQRDINAGVEQLAAACETVYVAEGIPDQGYYVAPRLFKGDADVVHQHEVFGPVATIVPFDGSAEAVVAGVAKGGGGLVCSVYSDKADWGGQVVLGLAPWHGRIFWGSRKIHDQSPGPGTVLPGFVHGGPGKAGGGEELGGLRGLRFYMQRTAIQADRGLLAKVLK